MKRIIPYAVVFLLSTGAAAVIVVGVLLFTPELLPTSVTAPADSVVAAAGHEGALDVAPEGATDSTQIHATPADTTRKSTPHLAQSADSVSTVPAANHKVSATMAEFSLPAMDSTRTAPEGADSTRGEQRKSMAKVLEAMDPESAARILNGFPDGDVKQIILTIKRRQAAKILAALDPDRAARIMR